MVEVTEMTHFIFNPPVVFKNGVQLLYWGSIGPILGFIQKEKNSKDYYKKFFLKENFKGILKEN